MKYLMIFLLFALVSCENIKYGNVTSKQYRPEMTWVSIIPIPHTIGKVTVTTMIPIIHHRNESWVINVSGIGDKGNKMEDCFYVDKIAFDTISIGQFMCVDGLCNDDTATHKTRQ